MTNVYPDPDTLERYLAMLARVLVDARFRAYQRDPQLAELLDAMHNTPDLLTRWDECDGDLIVGALEAYETKYGLSGRPYSRILRDGPRDGWQLRWCKGADANDPSSGNT